MSCHVEIIGQGQPLVMLHGWGMHSGVWQHLVKTLSKNYMIYMIDLPGHGESRPVEPYHLYSLAEQVAEVIPGVSDILGWSLGGQVAKTLALMQPDRVRRLILVSSTPCFVNKIDWQHGIHGDVFESFADNVNKDYQKTIMQFLTLQAMHSWNAKLSLRLLRKAFQTKPTPTQTTLQRALHILTETDLRAEVAKIRKPTLLIHGDRDTLAPVQAAHWMMQQLPMGFLRVISGSAHAPFLSHTEQFIEALNQFLEPNAS